MGGDRIFWGTVPDPEQTEERRGPRTGVPCLPVVLHPLHPSLGTVIQVSPSPPIFSCPGTELSPARQPASQNCPGRQGLLISHSRESEARAVSAKKWQSCCWKLGLWDSEVQCSLVPPRTHSLPTAASAPLNHRSPLCLLTSSLTFCLLELSSHRPVRRRGKGCPLRRKRGAGQARRSEQRLGGPATA